MFHRDSAELDLNPFYRQRKTFLRHEKFQSILHLQGISARSTLAGNNFDEITDIMYESINVILNHVNVRARFDSAGLLYAILQDKINGRWINTLVLELQQLKQDAVRSR